MDEVAIVQAADKLGFKYTWATEHHFLTEYSHLSANEVFLGYLAAATTNIHLGSGIFNITPPVNHPARVAERVALLDHLSEGRFEFGMGRGSSTTEQKGFGIAEPDLTRDMFDEVVGEFVKMWSADEYPGHDGQYFSMPARNVLPKPYAEPHPPMWVAAGNPATFQKAARMGLGVLCFTIGGVESIKPLVEVYKKEIANAEPVGAYVNNNLMVCISAYVAEDGQKARESLVSSRPNYLVSNVFRYHDTFPHPPVIPNWPDLIPDSTLDDIPMLIEGGGVVGDPDEALEQCRRWEETGVDQLVFGIGPAPIEETVAMIRLIGEHVIPKIDTDPVHSTDRYRAAARGANVAG